MHNLISIHAPTRGATPMPTVGSCFFIFQSTLPREERRLSAPVIQNHTDFNPRSHERSDVYVSGCCCDLFLFQSTLPREERRFCPHSLPRSAYFNPRSHERSDNYDWTGAYTGKDFNPRSHERSDSNIAQKICLFLYNTDNKYIIR